LEASAKRGAFAVGAGVAVAVGALILTFRIFSPQTLYTTKLTTTQSAAYPPEVLKLVADTETAFQLEDLKAVRTDIAALQQIAPTHPGLPFFESELKRREAEAAAARQSASASLNAAQRHTSASKPPDQHQPEVPTSPLRRRPASPSTFTGKTVEDSSIITSTTVAANLLDAPPAFGSPINSGSALTHEARIIQRVAAEYPEDAAKKGVEGAVDLSFTISSRGDVHDVTVVHAEPSSIFNRAAIAAVRRWKYEPRAIDGIPVDARVQVRLTFKLDGAHER
jgi:protein TonB